MQFMARFALAAGLTCAASLPAWTQDPPPALEDTVRRFYDAYLARQWATAENFVDTESRAVWRQQIHTGILRYEIRKFDMQAGGREAVATVGVDQPVQALGGEILTLTAVTRWQLSEGEWRLVMGGVASAADVQRPPRPPQPEPLHQIKFDYRQSDFGWRKQGERIEIHFPFTNISNEPIQVSASLVTFCGECMQTSVDKETVAPGERASVLFVLDSRPFSLDFHQGIGITVEPGGGTMNVEVIGFLEPLHPDEQVSR